eukprot:TRINITY_DN8694_c0_g1_i2.p1 TRINITY_DN8694_c0_g1~~TRINITY_DN8694_c0_g1_i2.p1  ORF type:complete len:273 (+),score=44.75 TRINITY_DN8694_c0_g1_i2:296-1114(+)
MGLGASNVAQVPTSPVQVEPRIALRVPGQPESGRAVRIVVISDTHNSHELINIPSGDVLIHAGDFTRYRRSAADIVGFNDWIGRQPHRHKIVIAGNHEIFLSPATETRTRELLSNCTYLQDSSVTVDGIKIYGSPWHEKRSFLYQAKAFGLDQAAISTKWDMIPDDVDILVTHSPPAGVQDINHKGYHMGSASLTETVLTRAKPRVHIFGHCHDSYGASVYDPPADAIEQRPVLFINAAQELVRKPVVIDFVLPTRGLFDSLTGFALFKSVC